MRKFQPLLALIVSLTAACASDPPPSCQDSMTHYYGVGCTFVNLQTNTATSLSDAIVSCQGINTEVPDQCRDKFESWISCINDVPNGQACTSCTQETDALFACH